MNLNKFAKEVTETEGLKVSVSIAQVKEVLRITFRKISTMGKVPFARFLVKIFTKY